MTVKNSKADSSSQSDAQNLKFERADWTSFRTVEGLQQKAGVAQDKLIRLVLKELTDNGLDTGAEVTVGEYDGGFFVEDEGPGLDPDEIPNLFSIARPLTSTKMLRLPTRGALGNGLRVAAGAVLASGGTLAVISRGVRLELKPQRDGITAVVKRSASDRRAGTRIEIGFGPALSDDPHALYWANLAIRLAKGGSSYIGQSSPYWYDAPQFHELLSASVGTSVRALVAELDGCAGGRAGEIVAAAGLTRTACHEVDALGAARLLQEARAVAKPVNPKRLGAVGPEGFPEYAYAIAYGEAKFGSSSLEAVIPYVVEAWAAKASRSVVLASVNRTPVAADFTLYHDKSDVDVVGCGLNHTVAKAPQGSKLTLWLNLMTPYMPITSDGKEPNLEPFLAGIVEAAGKAVRKRRGGSASGATQKDVVFDHLDEVIAEVSGPERYRFNDRQLFYRLRPIVLAEAGKELKLSNWKSILDAYEGENGEIELMYREPRGSLTHPHRNETFALRTIMVEQYVRPAWTFNKLLYIEKEGAQEALKQNRWLERHDCAVMSSKGFSTRAARDLIDKLVEHDEPIEVFCAHDADASGTMIYQTLQEATRARGARKIEIVNIGLEAWEAVAMRLEVETVEGGERRKPVADYVGLYEGDDNDWDEWLQTHRVELNAMTTPELIEWLDDKMDVYGLGKLIPPTKVLEDTFMTLAEEKLRAQITERILREADLDRQVAEAVAALDPPDGEALRRDIENSFADAPEAEWRDIIEAAADEPS